MAVTYQGEILLTTAETAAVLNVNPETVLTWCEEGVLSRRVIPGEMSHYVTLESLLRYRQESTTSVQKLAARVAALEQKVALLMTEDGAVQREDLAEIDDLIRRHHPHSR